MYKSFTLTLLFSVFSFAVLQAQFTDISNTAIKEPTSALSLMVGLTNYQGDLIEPTFDFGESNFAFGLRYSKYFSEKLTGNLGVLFGGISGSDADYDARVARGFELEKTSLVNVALSGDYYILGQNRYRKDENTAIYLNAGINLSFIDPEPTGILDGSEEDFGGSAFGVQIGGGLKQHLSERLSLAAELSFRPTFSDEIDGISKNGNPDNNDTFVWIGLAATYQLGEK